MKVKTEYPIPGRVVDERCDSPRKESIKCEYIARIHASIVVALTVSALKGSPAMDSYGQFFLGKLI